MKKRSVEELADEAVAAGRDLTAPLTATRLTAS